MLCPNPTVLNLLPNEDECKNFEIRAHSSLSEGQMHKIYVVFHEYEHEYVLCSSLWLEYSMYAVRQRR